MAASLISFSDTVLQISPSSSEGMKLVTLYRPGKTFFPRSEDSDNAAHLEFVIAQISNPLHSPKNEKFARPES